MGKLIIFIIVTISTFIITSCSATKNSFDYSIRYEGKSGLDPYTEVYIYDYKMEKEEWKQMKIYASRYPSPLSPNYMINIGSNISLYWLQQSRTISMNSKTPILNKPTLFYYYSEIPWSNFYYPLDNIKAKVDNLGEAIELSLNIYLQR
ncbi:MAG: hypothetical protein P8X47_08555 [Ignavibacteriaceae bacterium]|jgi:hypothetical protein